MFLFSRMLSYTPDIKAKADIIVLNRQWKKYKETSKTKLFLSKLAFQLRTILLIGLHWWIPHPSQGYLRPSGMEMMIKRLQRWEDHLVLFQQSRVKLSYTSKWKSINSLVHRNHFHTLNFSRMTKSPCMSLV